MRRALAMFGAVALLSATTARAALVDTFDPPNTAVTATQSGSTPGPVVTAAGPDGDYLRLINDGVNDQRNHYSYDTTDYLAAGMQYSSITATFDFAGYSGDQPADGFSFSLIPTSTYGNSGMGPNLSESAAAPGTFGLGFRTYPNTTNAVATYWNNQQILWNNVNLTDVSFRSGVWNQAQLQITPAGPGSYVTLQLTGDVNGSATAVTVYDRYVFGVTGYENRVQFSGRTGGANMTADLDNVNVTYGAAVAAPGTAGAYTGTFQDFDNLGTTPFTLTQSNSSPGPQILSGGPSGNYLRVIKQTGNQNNQIAFDRTDTGAYGTIEADWDFSVLTGADGGGFLLANTGWDGITGAVRNPGVWEDPNLANAFGIGFDVYPNRYGVSLHWDGQELTDYTAYDYRNAWRHAHAEIDYVSGGANISLDIDGNPIFTDYFIAGMTPYESRVAFGGRTGGANTNYDIDNVSVQWLNAIVPTDPYHWLGITGDYGTASLWTTAPTGSDNAVINIGVATGTAINVQGTGSLTVDGIGGLNNSSTLQVAGASGAQGNLILGGDAIVYSGGDFYIANGTGSLGYVTIGDNARLTVNGTHTVVGRSGGEGHVVQDGGTVSLRRLFVTESSAPGSTYTLNGGTLTLSDRLEVGRTEAGTFTVNGGTLTTSNIIHVGTSGLGQFIQNGGTVNAAGGFYVANEQDNTGLAGVPTDSIYHITDGTLNVTGWHTVVGRGAVGHFVQDGGTVNLQRLFVAEFGNTAGSSYTMNGGTLNLNKRAEVGRSAAATFTQTGGTVNATAALDTNDPFNILVGGGSNVGVYNLQGGTLNVGLLQKGTNGQFNFTGGTLHAGTVSFDLVQNGGTLAPGNSPGITDVTGDYVLNAGTLEIEIEATGTPGVDYDQVRITGGDLLLDQDGGDPAVLSVLAGTGLSPTANDFFWIVNNTGDVSTYDTYGTFAGLDEGDAVSVAGRYYYIHYHADLDTMSFMGGNDVLLTSVPEPSTLALLFGLAAFGLLSYRRRRRAG